MLKFNSLWIVLCLFLAMLLLGCTEATSQEDPQMSPSQEFRDYWYAGQAEITRYKLEQARYGEIHDGDAVMIFVTEDFLNDKQVKYEGGPRGNNVEPILKLNATRKFYTGIYPYSMMTSIFTPVDVKKSTLKVTNSSQEWCGHTYSQLNLRKKHYEGRLHSYFMAEADLEFELDAVLLEDEIWTKIRLNPHDLPTGMVEMIPSTIAQRLKHRTFAVERANATLVSFENSELSENTLMKYTLSYEDFQRTLEITFDSKFPYTIFGWEETMESGFGSGKKTLTTKAIRTHSINSAYWGQHDVADAPLREKLGLE